MQSDSPPFLKSLPSLSPAFHSLVSIRHCLFRFISIIYSLFFSLSSSHHPSSIHGWFKLLDEKQGDNFSVPILEDAAVSSLTAKFEGVCSIHLLTLSHIHITLYRSLKCMPSYIYIYSFLYIFQSHDVHLISLLQSSGAWSRKGSGPHVRSCCCCCCSSPSSQPHSGSGSLGFRGCTYRPCPYFGCVPTSILAFINRELISCENTLRQGQRSRFFLPEGAGKGLLRQGALCAKACVNACFDVLKICE